MRGNRMTALLTGTHRYEKTLSTRNRGSGVIIRAPILAYLVETPNGRVLYDVGSDSFLPVAARTDPNEHSVGAGCWVDAGNEYLLIGRKLVHLTTGHVARLPFIDLGSNSYEVYRWFGPETVTFGPRGPIALPAGS